MTIERALLSVSDKRGLVDFAKGLADLGVKLLSTGGTARMLREAGLPVVDVAAYTASPEVMDGRVKTLHPRVHGGILCRDNDDDRRELDELGGTTIDLVCVNLYPFEQTVARGAPHDEVIENIDIGGPSMIRSAAKNHGRVTVVTDPDDYEEVLAALKATRATSAEFRARLASKAFSQTTAYDGAIAGYLTTERGDSADVSAGGQSDGFPGTVFPGTMFPGTLTLQFQKAYGLRYGENPHQRAAFYIERGAAAGALALSEAQGAGGKELSFNNLVDLEAALDAVREFEQPAAVVVKHTNPCGVARHEKLSEAYRIAREADALSAFGGIVALNREVQEDTAAIIAETFIECVVAPGFAPAALKVLQKKKNLRVLATKKWLDGTHPMLQYKRIGGGLVVQERDASGGAELRGAKVVSKRAPTDDEMRALDFSWRVCKHVKSNAIVLGGPDQTFGVGAGQMSRVVSMQLAVEKAADKARGSVAASDAFFPFADGVEAAARAGVTAVVQPGGSKRDGEVIAAADAAGMAMVLTGVRHFRH